MCVSNNYVLKNCSLLQQFYHITYNEFIKLMQKNYYNFSHREYFQLIKLILSNKRKHKMYCSSCVLAYPSLTKGKSNGLHQVMKRNKERYLRRIAWHDSINIVALYAYKICSLIKRAAFYFFVFPFMTKRTFSTTFYFSAWSDIMTEPWNASCKHLRPGRNKVIFVKEASTTHP
jgi:hypothetical protein